MDETYSLDQIVGKTLFAKKQIVAYYNTDKSKVFRTFKAGERLGELFSWMVVKGQMWYMMEKDGATKKHYWILHSANGIDVNKLKQQGALSKVEEKKAAEKKKLDDRSTIDKVSESIAKTAENTAKTIENASGVGKYLVPAVGVAAVVAIGFMVYKNSEKITDKIMSV
jgi:hypothetical protein